MVLSGRENNNTILSKINNKHKGANKMKIEQIIESEKEQLRDYLYGYCDNPLAYADDNLINLFKSYNLRPIHDADKIRTILEDNETNTYFPGGIPGNTPNSIWLPLGEIEIDSDMVEPEEKDDFTFTNNFAYYYIGYGLILEYDITGIQKDLKDCQ